MRIKVVCAQKQPWEDGAMLNFSVVYSGSEENKEFFKYTPGGIINFNVVRKEVADKYEIGKEYYVTFCPAQ